MIRLRGPAEPDQQALDGGHERWNVLVNSGLDNRPCRVEITVRQLIAHPSDITPRDAGFGRQDLRIDVLHCLADLDETDANRVEHQPIVKAAPAQVGGDRLGGVDDVP